MPVDFRLGFKAMPTKQITAAALALGLTVASSAVWSQTVQKAPTTGTGSAAVKQEPVGGDPLSTLLSALQGDKASSLNPVAHFNRASAAIGELRKEVIMRAFAMLGVGYKLGGNSIEDGLDCSGFVRLVMRDVLGYSLPRRSEEISRAGQSIEPNELQPGDLVFFNTMQRAFSHVGIYIGNSQFIHAPRTGGVVRIEDLGKKYWSERFNGARRLLGAPEVKSNSSKQESPH